MTFRTFSVSTSVCAIALAAFAIPALAADEDASPQWTRTMVNTQDAQQFADQIRDRVGGDVDMIVYVAGEAEAEPIGGGADPIEANDTGVATHGPNLIVQGSFEDVTGMDRQKFGFTGNIPGWTMHNENPAEVVIDGWIGVPASDGRYWIDTGTVRDKVLDISQTIHAVENGTNYILAFDAGQWAEPSAFPDDGLLVYWNGQPVAELQPQTIDGYERFEFMVTGGTGNGSNTVRFVGRTDGTSDSQGVVLDNVSLTEVLGEAAGATVLGKADLGKDEG